MCLSTVNKAELAWEAGTGDCKDKSLEQFKQDKDQMDKIEKQMGEIVQEDAFLKDLDLTWLCVARIAQMRQRTELLGSVEAVEQQFQQVAEGVQALSKLAAATTTCCRQYTATAVALKKARKAEKAAQEREDKKKKTIEDRKLRAAEAAAKKKENETGGDTSEPEPQKGGKKRRAPANAGFTESDPLVLKSAWPSGSDYTCTVMESYVSWIQIGGLTS